MEKNGKMIIKMLTTGGTIEKSYDEEDGQLLNRESIIQEKILKKMRLPYTEVQLKSLLAKDSLHMDESDREFLCQALKVEAKDGHPIIILHGTDTLSLSANYCFKHLENLAVPIIFTGAMRPLEFDETDAKQNVMEALMAAKIVSPGIYLVFHNRLYSAPYFQKNPKLRTFESVASA